MAEKPNETAVPRPPRALRGRRARGLWRKIAPIAHANGRLSAASAPFLLLLCKELSEVYEKQGPGAFSAHVSDRDLKRMRDLAKSFGILP